ncbi:hypothetical protein V8E51_016696 [Hyaloscypha variabilis]
MSDLSQCLQDNPLPTEQAFNDEYNRWIHWAFIHVEVSENDPMSPPQQGLQESQEVSELQRYQAEYFMWRAHYRQFGPFHGINPQGSWLPDDDACQTSIDSARTPRASQQHHHAAQDNTKVVMDARLNAIESRLASLESRVGALELVHGRTTRCQHDTAMVQRSRPINPLQPFQPDPQSPSPFDSSWDSLVASEGSLLRSDPADLLSGGAATPLSSSSRANTPPPYSCSWKDFQLYQF